MLACVMGEGGGGGGHRDDVRDNTTTTRMCASPKGRPRDQDWSHFDAGRLAFSSSFLWRGTE